jgi:hypothetical protein
MSYWKFMKYYYKDLRLLPPYENLRLVAYGRDAASFERFMSVVALIAGLITVVGLLLDSQPIWVRALTVCVGCLVIGMIGGEIKMRRFRRLTAAAIDKYREQEARLEARDAVRDDG